MAGMTSGVDVKMTCKYFATTYLQCRGESEDAFDEFDWQVR
jgi:hypothetical protein